MNDYEFYWTIFHGLLGLFSLMGIVSIVTSMLIKPEKIPYPVREVVYHDNMVKYAAQVQVEPEFHFRSKEEYEHSNVML